MNTNDIQITLPSSKSLSVRWLLVDWLASEKIPLTGLSQADDVKVMKRILGIIKNNVRQKPMVLDCGDAASVARFILAALAMRPGEYVITGSSQLCGRPMMPLVKALQSMEGPELTYLEREGYLPIKVKGNTPKRKLVAIDPTQSSQFVSALLFAGTILPNGLNVRMTVPPPSRPYIEMSCKVLSAAGANNDYAPHHTTIRVSPFVHRNHTRPIAIERDWSAAAFFYMAALFLPHRRFRLLNLSKDSLQGDAVAADLFKHLGVSTLQSRSPYRGTNSLLIEGGGEATQRLVYNLGDNPDLIPPVAVACAAMGVDAIIKGIETLRYKESDRLKAIAAELAKMNGQVTITDKHIHIHPSALHPVEPVETYSDHRIAMSFGMLKILFPDIVIKDPQVVNKSFPLFWEQLGIVMKAIC